MTEPRESTEPAEASGPPGSPGRPRQFDPPGEPRPDLLAEVTSVPGVHAIEPGLGTSLRTLDARLRRSQERIAHFGLHIDTAEGTAVVEVALDRSRPVRETVRDVQLALRRSLAKHDGQAEDTAAAPAVTVRVQSLHR